MVHAIQDAAHGGAILGVHIDEHGSLVEAGRGIHEHVLKMVAHGHFVLFDGDATHQFIVWKAAEKTPERAQVGRIAYIADEGKCGVGAFFRDDELACQRSD